MRDAKRSLEPQSPSRSPVGEPRRKFTKLALSGGRAGLEVRAGLKRGTGLGLFAGPDGIPPGGTSGILYIHRVN